MYIWSLKIDIISMQIIDLKQIEVIRERERERKKKKKKRMQSNIENTIRISWMFANESNFAIK